MAFPSFTAEMIDRMSPHPKKKKKRGRQNNCFFVLLKSIGRQSGSNLQQRKIDQKSFLFFFWDVRVWYRLRGLWGTGGGCCIFFTCTFLFSF